MAIGDAFIEVHADTDPFDREVRRDTDRLLDDIEKEVDKGGKEVGEKLADSVTDELGKHGKEMGQAITDGLKGHKIRPTGIKFELDAKGNVIKQTITGRIIDEITDAFDDASRPGGPFSKIGTGISDAIGAGFNVSGRSPLIALLIPLIGVIIALVVGAIQAVGALLAIIGTIPALIASIGFQIGVVAIAFQGVGAAISGAFAAKNAKELKKALEDLTPSAQKFVREILSLKDEFKAIQKIAQESFFKGAEGSITRITQALLPLLGPGVARVSTAMGELFGHLADFFASPSFVEFVKQVIPSTVRFLEKFGPQFVTFLTGLIDIAVASMPFLERLGLIIGGIFEHIGQWLTDTSKTLPFQTWLDDMASTLDSIADLFFEVIDFVRILLDELNQAGGQEVIKELANAFATLGDFFKHPIGKKALEGIVNFAIIAIRVFIGLTVGILGVIALFEFLGEKINQFKDWLINTAGPAIGRFFTETLPGWFESARKTVAGWITAVVNFFIGLGLKIAIKFNEIKAGIIQKFEEVKAYIKGIPGKILGFFAGIGSLLFQKGKDLVFGFLGGVKSMVTNGAVGRGMAAMVNAAVAALPGSPAKEGPLSGKGWTFYRGQRMMEDFARGIETGGAELGASSIDAVSNIFVGPGAIRLGFEGALPTAQQAMGIGAAAGNGFMDQLAVRNARLAVRSL